MSLIYSEDDERSKHGHVLTVHHQGLTECVKVVDHGSRDRVGLGDRSRRRRLIDQMMREFIGTNMSPLFPTSPTEQFFRLSMFTIGDPQLNSIFQGIETL